MLAVSLHVYIRNTADKKLVNGIKKLVQDVVTGFGNIAINSTPFNDIGVSLRFILAVASNPRKEDVERIYRLAVRRFQWVMERIDRYGLRYMRGAVVIDYNGDEKEIAEELARKLSFLDTHITLAEN